MFSLPPARTGPGNPRGIAVIRPPTDNGSHHGFSLVELVIVIVIIGIIAAIAVPRISSAGQAARRNAVQANLALVRKAVDLFYVDHGRFPGFNPDGGGADGLSFVDQLTLYSDADGFTSATPGYPFVYGPYLRLPFPVNSLNGLATVTVREVEATAVLPNSSGWVATLSSGAFESNTAHQQIENASTEAEFEELPVAH
jgi:general secretion pathway protein G